SRGRHLGQRNEALFRGQIDEPVQLLLRERLAEAFRERLARLFGRVLAVELRKQEVLLLAELEIGPRVPVLDHPTPAPLPSPQRPPPSSGRSGRPARRNGRRVVASAIMTVSQAQPTPAGLRTLNATEIRSPGPSNGSTRCSSHDGNRSKSPVAGVNGMPMPDPTHGRSIPGVSYMATAGPRGSRK